MPRLPSEQDLGPTPSLESRRGTASYDTSPLARGAAALGQGAQSVGNALVSIGVQRQEREDKQAAALQEAQAKSQYLVGKIDLDQARGDETDPAALDGYRQKYADNIAKAAALIQDPERAKLFQVTHEPEAEQGHVAALTRQFSLKQDASLAQLGDRNIQLQNSAARAGSDADVTALGQAGQAEIQARLDAGYISEQQAAQMRRDLGDRLASAYYQRLSPQQRIEALTPIQTGERTKQAYQYFTAQGWSPAAAAGIVGGLVHESGLKTTALNPGDGSDGSDSIGLAQWNSGRAAALKSFADARGKPATDYATQLAFVDHELRTTEGGAAAKLRAATTPRQAAEAFVTFERPAGWERGATSAHGWGNRLRQAEGVFSAYGGGTLPQIPGQGTADMLLPHQRELILRHAEAEDDANARKAQQAMHQEAQGLNARISDDLASIEATGKSNPNLRVEDVQRVLGPQAAQSFLQDRARSAGLFNAMDGLQALPEAEALQRLQRLQPRPGAEGFQADAQTYDRARKQVDQLLSLRRTDPARSVEGLPAVADARTNGQYDTAQDGRKVPRPDSAQAIIRARLAAQDQLGIGAPLAVTRQEAGEITRQVHVAGDDVKKLTPFLTQMRTTYGPLAERVLADSFQLHGMNQDLADAATQALSKIGAGMRPNPFETRNLDRAVGRQQMDDALAGRGAQPAPAGAPAGRAATSSEPPELKGSPQGRDIAELYRNRSDPAVLREFDATYGAGTAQRVLAETDRRLGAREAR